MNENENLIITGGGDQNEEDEDKKSGHDDGKVDIFELQKNPADLELIQELKLKEELENSD